MIPQTNVVTLQKDLKVYKLFRPINGNLCETVDEKLPVSVPGIIKEEPLIFPKFYLTMLKFFRDDIDSGWIFSYLDKDKIASSMFIQYECVIPKGTQVIYGTDGDIASKELMVIRQLKTVSDYC
jgi:hypothetical protein